MKTQFYIDVAKVLIGMGFFNRELGLNVRYL
jgi:hypothetical protein